MEDLMYELGIGEYADMDAADYYDMMSAASEYDDEDDNVGFVTGCDPEEYEDEVYFD
jgi:hypothetical protein